VAVKTRSAAAARRYARALLDVALELRLAERVRGELAEASGLLSQHAELREALTHPGVAPANRAQLVSAIWGQRGASEPFVRLMVLLAERDRMTLLPAIEGTYVALWNAHRGVVSAEAITAVELEEEQRSALAGAIEKAVGAEIELQARVDPGVQGGVCVRLGGRVYDGTLRARLRALREQLVGGSQGA
jgi:F-type H+-transporting ATPase subunit delta